MAAVAAISLIASCKSAPESTAAEPTPEEVGVFSVRADRTTVGHSVHGRPIECWQLDCAEPAPSSDELTPIKTVSLSRRSTVLFLGGIHGDEPAGTPLLKELVTYLTEAGAQVCDGRVIIVPAANPDGLEAGTRANSNGVDLNRNFPTSNWKPSGGKKSGRYWPGPSPMSEPEARALVELIAEIEPDLIVTVHQPLACIDYDGPRDEAASVARAMADACDLPVRKLGARGGSLGSFGEFELHVPVVTVELRRGDTARTGPELWGEYGEMLLAALEFANLASAK